MRPRLALAVLAFVLAAGTLPASAEPSDLVVLAASKTRGTAKSTREPTAGQMAARERQKKCGVEWREAKANGKTGGLKWPQYWSKCNARLKGGEA